MISDIRQYMLCLVLLQFPVIKSRFVQHAQITRNVTTERQPLCKTMFTAIHNDGNVNITAIFTVTYHKRQTKVQVFWYMTLSMGK